MNRYQMQSIVLLKLKNIGKIAGQIM